jgi:hypothetical protein
LSFAAFASDVLVDFVSELSLEHDCKNTISAAIMNKESSLFISDMIFEFVNDVCYVVLVD